ncbi:MAG: hypothetical protein ABSE64_08120 [Vulcanimicrobiaceae bacterium]
MPVVVGDVARLLGERLACYIADVKDARTLRSWERNGHVPLLAGRRLQMALAAALTLQERFDDPARIAPWFTWLNDMLDDVSPATSLREAVDDDVEQRGQALLNAARRELID